MHIIVAGPGKFHRLLGLVLAPTLFVFILLSFYLFGCTKSYSSVSVPKSAPKRVRASQGALSRLVSSSLTTHQHPKFKQCRTQTAVPPRLTTTSRTTPRPPRRRSLPLFQTVRRRRRAINNDEATIAGMSTLGMGGGERREKERMARIETGREEGGGKSTGRNDGEEVTDDGGAEVGAGAGVVAQIAGGE